jgi:lysophospholipase L1-like esterase
MRTPPIRFDVRVGIRMPLRVAVLICLAVVGSVACKKGGGETPTGPGPIPQPNTAIFYTAIGASDAVGYGSSVPCLPFDDCPNGRGYVQNATRELRTRGFTVNLTNVGFPAHVLSPRIEALGTQYGRIMTGNFLQRQASFVPANTTLVTIFAGGNDVDTIIAALGGGAGGADQAAQTAYINSQIDLFGQEFASLINQVRTLAPSARIVVLNLPNMAGMPRHQSAPLQHRRAEQMLSVGITTRVINPYASSGVLIVDLMCDPRSYQASTYFSDGFHPSDAGYAWIAAEVVAAATTSYRAPAASCAHNTIVQ